MPTNNAMQEWNPPIRINPTTAAQPFRGNITLWPDTVPYTQPVQWPVLIRYDYPPQSRVCSGDVHVFPCAHCDRCQCGAATVTREQ